MYINPFSKTSFFVLTNMRQNFSVHTRVSASFSTVVHTSKQSARLTICCFSLLGYYWTCEFLGALALIALAILSSISANFKLEHVNVEFLRSLHLQEPPSLAPGPLGGRMGE